MRNKLLVIGAGASFGARENDSCLSMKPPLGNELLSYLKICVNQLQNNPNLNYFPPKQTQFFSHGELQTIEDLVNASELIGIENFEKFSRMLFLGSRFLSHFSLLNRFIAFSMSYSALFGLQVNAFENKVDLYDDLLKKEILTEENRWSVISLNYDCLFEQALCRSNTRWHYTGLTLGKRWTNSANRNGIPLLKIHGSINWFPGHEKKIVLKYDQDTGFPDIYEGPLFDVDTNSSDIYSELTDRIREVPALAVYAEHKPPLRAGATLAEIRTKAMIIAKECKSALIIGIRPVLKEQDDYTLFQILRALKSCILRPKTIRYINPSILEIDQTIKTFGFKDSYCIRKSLKEFLRS